MSSNLFTPPLYTATSSHSPPPLQAQQPPSSSTTSSAVIVVIVIASAVVLSTSIYILLRCLSKHLNHNHNNSSQTHPANDVVLPHHHLRTSSSATSGHHVETDKNNALLNSLPLFSFRSVVKGNLTGGDCAVCLSKFEAHDQLRLLPLCCHAFHAACIDAWIVSNRTCPLCRSTVVPTDRDVFDKIQQIEPNNNNSLNNGNRSRSFRIELGSISRRRGGLTAAIAAEGDQRTTTSYSIGGSFEYVVDETGNFEVSVDVDCADKEASVVGVPVSSEEALAAEVGGGGGWRSNNHNWLRDYVDRLGFSSRAMSFRGSGRFFSGSSRRSEAVITAAEMGDLEANRVGEEISELFRWLSGV